LPPGFMSEKGWNVLADYYRSLSEWSDQTPYNLFWH
jgi:hypothetical protein